MSDLADLGCHAGPDDHRPAMPPGYDGSRKYRVVHLGQGQVAGALDFHWSYNFLHRHGFPRERRLLGLELDLLKQPRIGGDLIPRPEENDITGNQFGGVDFLLQAVPQGNRLEACHLLESLYGALGAEFLEEAEDGVEKENHGYYERVDSLAYDGGYYNRPHEDIDDRRRELAEQHAPPLEARRLD